MDLDALVGEGDPVVADAVADGVPGEDDDVYDDDEDGDYDDEDGDGSPGSSQ